MQILINNIDLTEYYIPQTLRIEDEINARSTCNFRMVDVLGALSITNGQPIEIYQDSVLIFGGFTFFPKKFNPVGTETLYFDIECVDNHIISDRFIVAEAYVNQTVPFIVNDLINTYLAGDGVTAGIIETSEFFPGESLFPSESLFPIQDFLLTEALFPRVASVSSALDELAEITGLSWYIDYDKKLYFIARNAISAPFNIENNSAIVNINVREDKSRYRNRQFIRGGDNKTQLINNELPTPIPDGVSRTFVTRFPIAEKPTIIINSVVIDPVDVGVNGRDEGKKFYFSIGERTITQDDSETVLDGDTIGITYRGLFPLLVVAEDSQAIADRIAIEGGTGIYEAIDTEPKINNQDLALEIAQGKLRKFSKVERELTYETYTAGLFAGQLQIINLSRYNINNGEFLIDRMSIQDLDGQGTFVHSVHAVDGESFGGWTEFFKQRIRQDEKLSIKSDETLILLNSQFEQQNWGESLNFNVIPCPLPNDLLFPEEDLIPC
jgi:hypothetical protein